MTQEALKKKIIKAVETDPYKDVIKSISIFGSYLHGNPKPDSDIDLLLELRRTVGLFTLGGIQYNLEKKLGKKVDLVEKESVDKYIKDNILSEAKKVYEYK